MDENTTICSGIASKHIHNIWWSKMKFGFVAVFRGKNEVGIKVRIPISYKYEIGDCTRSMQSPVCVI